MCPHFVADFNERLKLCEGQIIIHFQDEVRVGLSKLAALSSNTRYENFIVSAPSK